MEELKISLPGELKSKIEEHPEINWQLLFKRTVTKILNRISLIEFLETKLDKSGFTEQDALELSETAKQHRLEELKSQGII